MIKRISITGVLLTVLILPLWPGHTRVEAGGGASPAFVEICETNPCKELIENRLTCFMPPRTNCRNCPTPGFAVAILKHTGSDAADARPEVVFEGATGFANFEGSEPIKITSDTVFDLASVTKQFTAAAIMMLIDDKVEVKGSGPLSVDTPLSEILPQFTGQGKDIVVADLLTHQSGLPDYIDLYQRRHNFNFKKNLEKGRASWYEKMNRRPPPRPGAINPEATNSSVLEMIEKAEPTKGKPPGTDFMYSNSGYVVLARIIETLSPQKSYKRFLQERIFTPLKMTHTFVFDEEAAFIPNHAFPYRHGRDGKYFAMEGYTPLNFIYGDGNIHSTLSDMIKWVQAIDDVEHGRNEKLLKRETLAAAFASTRLRENMAKPLRYGFGWFVARKNRTTAEETIRVIFHEGDWFGFHSFVLDGHIDRLGKTVCELTIIVLSNFEAEKNDPSQNRPCHLVRELSKLFWGANKEQNIILDDFKMNCGTDPRPTCAEPVPNCNSSRGR